MKKILFFPALIIFNIVSAQTPDDVPRYSFFPQNGTARTLAIGGAMGSLGGDITATFVNPAGLAMYRTSDFVLTPGYIFNNNKTDFRGTNTQNKKNSFALGTSGFVFGFDDGSNDQDPTAGAISIAFTQTANFNNIVHYSGSNDHSSFAEQWAEAAAKSGESLDAILNDPQFAFGTAPAVYTYLIDTFRQNDNSIKVKALPEFVLNNGQALQQDNLIQTKGGLYEAALGFGIRKSEKFYYGVTLSIPILNYDNNSTFTETDPNNASNLFGSFTYSDHYHVTGVGFNLKAGIIYKPKENIRLGLAFHTPTLFPAIKESRTTNLDANTEDYNKVASVSSTFFTNQQPGLSKYELITPFKAIISGSYILSEVEDVTKQKGFITADIEYVHHHGTSFLSAENAPDQTIQDYYSALNNVIRDQYKGNVNFRVGGELKFTTIMTRLGFAYYGNPYKDPALKAGRLLLSGGLGYRNKGYFIDLTYIYSMNKDVHFPYRLEDKSNTFAVVKNQLGNLVATIGFKF